MTLAPDGSAINQVWQASDDAGVIAIMKLAVTPVAAMLRHIAVGDGPVNETGETADSSLVALPVAPGSEVIGGFSVHPAAPTPPPSRTASMPALRERGGLCGTCFSSRTSTSGFRRCYGPRSRRK